MADGPPSDSRPRLLDLFCGAGGAAMGYHRAGFDVVGVDIVDQPRYPFTFHRADATTFPLDGFDAIHASPPCQDHTELWSTRRDHGTGWMLGYMLDRLRESGRPYVVENVPGARGEMPGAFTLCARGLGIDGLRRHRLFVSNVLVLVPPCSCDATSPIYGVYGDLSLNDRYARPARAGERRRQIRAGIQHARAELSQAIPPAYTELIGANLIGAIA